jgi:hypothetical protein
MLAELLEDTPRVKGFLCNWTCTGDKLLTSEVGVVYSVVDGALGVASVNIGHGLVYIRTLLKCSPSIGPERKLLATSLYLTFNFNSNMVQLAEPCPIFVRASSFPRDWIWPELINITRKS